MEYTTSEINTLSIEQISSNLNQLEGTFRMFREQIVTQQGGLIKVAGQDGDSQLAGVILDKYSDYLKSHKKEEIQSLFYKEKSYDEMLQALDNKNMRTTFLAYYKVKESDTWRKLSDRIASFQEYKREGFPSADFVDGAQQWIKENELSVGIDTSYKSETVHASGYTQYSSNLTQLANEFNFEEKQDLLSIFGNDSKILVLGSGEGTTVSDLRRSLPSSEIIDFNPAFVRKDFRELYPERKMDSPKKITIAGINPVLPFKSGSLDVVIDDFSSVYVANEDVDKSTERIIEINRVIKEGGKAFVGPFKTKEIFDIVCANLADKGIKFEKVTKQYPDLKGEISLELYRLVLTK